MIKIFAQFMIDENQNARIWAENLHYYSRYKLSKSVHAIMHRPVVFIKIIYKKLIFVVFLVEKILFSSLTEISNKFYKKYLHLF